MILEKPKDHPKYQTIRDFLCENIFKEENKVIRNFFDRMLAKDKDVDKYEIHRAVLNNDEQRIKDLLEQNGDIINTIDKVGRTALHLAAAYGYKNILQALLMKHGVNVNIYDNLFGWSPLTYADKGNYWGIAELLLKKGAKSNDMVEAKSIIKRTILGRGEKTLLHIAAAGNNIEFAKVIIRAGIYM